MGEPDGENWNLGLSHRRKGGGVFLIGSFSSGWVQ